MQERKRKKSILWSLAVSLILVALMSGCSSSDAMESSTQKETESVITSEIVESTVSETELTMEPTTSEPQQPSELKVHFIDVGQGDSTLIQSNDKYMLVDAGENEYGDTVVTYLHNQGIEELDYVIGTHPHSDHIGGLDDVINNFKVDTVIIPPVEHTTKTFEDVLDAIDGQGLKITKPEVGKTYQIGDASFQILAPNQDYGDDLNNWSVGIKVTNGEESFIISGDAEKQSESDICSNSIDISAAVLKLGHHGSRTASTDTFLDKVNPQFAVISCGMGNSYGHPHQETLDKLSSRSIKVYRTDEQGTVIATSTGSGITWSTEPSTSWNAGISKENASSAAEELSEVVETTESSTTEAQKTGLTYILNTKTKKFHKPSCGSLPTSNRKDTDMSRDEIIASGYAACKKCNP